MSVSPGGVGVMGLAEWWVLAGWTDSWLNGWKITQSQLPACHCWFPERAKPQPSFQHTLHPLIIIPATVYSLPTQAQHTHTHTDWTQDQPGKYQLTGVKNENCYYACFASLCLSSITHINRRTRICSLCTIEINTPQECNEKTTKCLFFFKPSTSCSHLYYLAQRWVHCCTYILRSFL